MSGKKQKYANDPMLFIHQPNIQIPKAQMQDSYISSKKENSSSPTVKSEEKSNIKKRRNTFSKQFKAELEEDEAESSLDEYRKEKVKGNTKQKSRKQFKDMTNREKIDYFLNMPEFAPKLKCEIRADKSYRGTVTNFVNEEVIMQSGRRTVKIDFEQIKEIKLLGF